MAQLVKNLLIMRETWVPFLGWEDPLEKAKATHSSFLAWRIPWTRVVHAVSKSWTQLSDFSLSLQDERIICIGVILLSPVLSTFPKFP